MSVPSIQRRSAHRVPGATVPLLRRNSVDPPALFAVPGNSLAGYDWSTAPKLGCCDSARESVQNQTPTRTNAKPTVLHTWKLTEFSPNTLASPFHPASSHPSPSSKAVVGETPEQCTPRTIPLFGDTRTVGSIGILDKTHRFGTKRRTRTFGFANTTRRTGKVPPSLQALSLCADSTPMVVIVPRFRTVAILAERRRNRGSERR